jgi:hypothetical protein
MHLSDQGFIVILVVGLIAGSLAGKVVRGNGLATLACVLIDRRHIEIGRRRARAQERASGAIHQNPDPLCSSP